MKLNGQPNVTVKWRDGEPPYVELHYPQGVLLAGWLYPEPNMIGTGEPKPRDHNDYDEWYGGPEAVRPVMGPTVDPFISPTDEYLRRTHEPG